jgi:pimeloyl-ACP methyl ester carboxylesterase
LSSWSFNRELFSDEEVAEYVKAYSQPGALKGCFNDYRAAPEDTAQDVEDALIPIACPILAMWGADFELVGKMFDVEAVWKTMGNLVKAVALPECGHLPQEEQPELVNTELVEFLKDWRG